MKKIVIFLGIIILIFISLYLIQKEEPKKENFLYKNEISSENLNKSIASGDPNYIYFYQTDCIHCKKVSPVIIPMAEDLNIDLKVHDLQKNQENWDTYNIQGTPTIVYYKDGKEIDRIHGEQPKETYEQWFKNQK